MPPRAKIPDEQVLIAWERWKSGESIRSIAEEYGVAYQTLVRRMRKLIGEEKVRALGRLRQKKTNRRVETTCAYCGKKITVPLHELKEKNYCSQACAHKDRRKVDEKIIEEAYQRWKKGEPLYKIAKDVGVSDVALFKAIEKKYGREEAKRLGKLARLRGREKIRKVFLDRIDVKKLREVFDKYRRSNFNLVEFSRHYKDFIEERLGFHGPGNLSKAFRHFFPEEYVLVRENKMGHTYQRGRYWEYRVRDYFRNKGYFVWRSPASKGPADLIAIKKGEIILVQCKISGSLSAKERNELETLAKSVGAKALLAQRNGRKIVLRDVFKIEKRPTRRKGEKHVCEKEKS